MKVLLTGGGTGGHITPLLAVAHELKLQRPDIKIIYVGEHHGKFSHLTDEHPDIDQVYTVYAGKFRRYHQQSLLSRLLDAKTNLLNLRDLFYFLFGTLQSWRLLGKVKPDVIFLKGGFVGVPIGLAAASRHIPFITHDSDALPGLANRLVGRWASLHATALPVEYYPYKAEQVRTVGVLVEHSYQPVTNDQKMRYKQQIGLPADAKMILVTGGSSGAETINVAIRKNIEAILEIDPQLWVVHQVGKSKMLTYEGYHHDRLIILEFLTPMHVFMAAADLVVTRASANTLAELGIQGKATIAIPGSHLTGGHQLKNAQRLVEQEAAIVIPEERLYDTEQGLLPTIKDLLKDESKRNRLANKLQNITLADAARQLANLLLEQTK